MEGKIHTPEQMPELFAEAWNMRRADKLAALFEEEADFINVVGLWWEDRNHIYKAHEYGLRVIFGHSTLTVGRVKVKQVAPDCTVIHARMRLTGQTGHGSEAGIRQTLFLFVLCRHGDNSWLCTSAQNTDIVAGAETHIRKEDGSLIPVDYRDT